MISGWGYSTHYYNSATFGDHIAACRVGIKIFRKTDTNPCMKEAYISSEHSHTSTGYGDCLRSDLNTTTDL